MKKLQRLLGFDSHEYGGVLSGSDLTTITKALRINLIKDLQISGDGCSIVVLLEGGELLGCFEGQMKLAVIPLPKKVTLISVGMDHFGFSVEDVVFNLYMSGGNAFGQLGLGDTVDRSIPCRLESLESCVETISCGKFYTMCVCESGQVYSWGSRDGRASQTNPKQVPALCKDHRKRTSRNMSSQGFDHLHCRFKGSSAFMWTTKNKLETDSTPIDYQYLYDLIEYANTELYSVKSNLRLILKNKFNIVFQNDKYCFPCLCSPSAEAMLTVDVEDSRRIVRFGSHLSSYKQLSSRKFSDVVEEYYQSKSAFYKDAVLLQARERASVAISKFDLVRQAQYKVKNDIEYTRGMIKDLENTKATFTAAQKIVVRELFEFSRDEERDQQEMKEAEFRLEDINANLIMVKEDAENKKQVMDVLETTHQNLQLSSNSVQCRLMVYQVFLAKKELHLQQQFKNSLDELAVDALETLNELWVNYLLGATAIEMYRSSFSNLNDSTLELSKGQVVGAQFDISTVVEKSNKQLSAALKISKEKFSQLRTKYHYLEIDRCLVGRAGDPYFPFFNSESEKHWIQSLHVSQHRELVVHSFHDPQPILRHREHVRTVDTEQARMLLTRVSFSALAGEVISLTNMSFLLGLVSSRGRRIFPQAVGVVYTDDNGSPGSLIATTNPGTVKDYGICELEFKYPVRLQMNQIDQQLGSCWFGLYLRECDTDIRVFGRHASGSRRSLVFLLPYNETQPRIGLSTDIDSYQRYRSPKSPIHMFVSANTRTPCTQYQHIAETLIAEAIRSNNFIEANPDTIFLDLEE